MTIQVFEHQRLLLNEDFQPKHLHAMLRFNDQHGNKYFTIVHRGVKFSHYVGVLQIGGLTIEILPKADDHAKGNKEVWRSVLLEMLRYTKSLKVETLSKAPLLLRQQSLLDIYLLVFLSEVQQLLHKGLVKQYQTQQKQQKALKGQLLFQQHITKNLIRKERFFTQSDHYETNHLLHQIIAKALKVIIQTTRNTTIKNQARQLLFRFPEVSDIAIVPQLFQKIQLNRKTAHYQSAVDVAQLILMNFCPDLKSGHFDILAILLDMNTLFEEFIFEALKKAVHFHGMTIKGQPSRKFWENKTTLRPDMVVQRDKTYFVLDTKWKKLKRATPQSEDLKQMFVYGHYFRAARSVLIYPKTQTKQTTQQGIFQQKMYDENQQKMVTQTCDLAFVNILNNRKLNKRIGEELCQVILNKN